MDPYPAVAHRVIGKGKFTLPLPHPIQEKVSGEMCDVWKKHNQESNYPRVWYLISCTLVDPPSYWHSRLLDSIIANLQELSASPLTSKLRGTCDFAPRNLTQTETRASGVIYLCQPYDYDKYCVNICFTMPMVNWWRDKGGLLQWLCNISTFHSRTK